MKIDKHYFGLKFIATAEETQGKYFLSETIIPAGDSGPPVHFHTREDEGFFLKKGQLTITVNEEEVQLNAGEFLNISKKDRHTWKNDSMEDAELLIIFAPAGIEKMFVELDQDMTQIKEIGLKYGTTFEM